MPPGYVKTIREEIFYEYAKLISRSAYGSLHRGFITDRFQKLRDGGPSWLCKDNSGRDIKW